MPAPMLLAWIMAAIAGMVVWAWACRALARLGPEPDLALALLANRLYCRVVHRLRVEGSGHIPTRPGALVVVANHTAGIDPLLIQAACPFVVRWMMARDMMHPRLGAFWRWLGVIPVDRSGRDTTSARAAIAHLRAGGVLGVFPEGGIERPPRRLRPFLAGVGLIVARTGAPVLPIIIDDTPVADPAWASLARPSRSTIRVLPIVHFDRGGDHDAITRALRELFERETGWPLNDSARVAFEPVRAVGHHPAR